MKGAELMTVTRGPWRLHVDPPGSGNEEGKPYRGPDPRGPDGVTILAPWEQRTEFPGVAGGSKPKPMMLFNVVEDPAEQVDVSARKPEVVAELMDLFLTEKATAVPMVRVRGKGLRYIQGGDFEYSEFGPPVVPK